MWKWKFIEVSLMQSKVAKKFMKRGIDRIFLQSSMSKGVRRDDGNCNISDSSLLISPGDFQQLPGGVQSQAHSIKCKGI
jgi:hypothetical protein